MECNADGRETRNPRQSTFDELIPSGLVKLRNILGKFCAQGQKTKKIVNIIKKILIKSSTKNWVFIIFYEIFPGFRPLLRKSIYTMKITPVQQNFRFREGPFRRSPPDATLMEFVYCKKYYLSLYFQIPHSKIVTFHQAIMNRL